MNAISQYGFNQVGFNNTILCLEFADSPALLSIPPETARFLGYDVAETAGTAEHTKGGVPQRPGRRGDGEEDPTGEDRQAQHRAGPQSPRRGLDHLMTPRVFPFLCVLLVAASTLLPSCVTMKPVKPARELRPVAIGDGKGSARTTVDPGAPAEVELLWDGTASLLVRPKINDIDVGWFVLDTGATGMLISGDGARNAGLLALGTTRLQNGSDTTVQIGGTLRDQMTYPERVSRAWIFDDTFVSVTMLPVEIPRHSLNGSAESRVCGYVTHPLPCEPDLAFVT